MHLYNLFLEYLTFSAEGLLEETFGINFLREVRAQNLIGVSAHAAQSQAMAASYHSSQGNISFSLSATRKFLMNMHVEIP